MKKLLSAVLFFQLASFAYSQDPVSWSYITKKVADKTFEVHITANLQSGWHLYSQKQPKDAIAVPTSFSFNKHPLIKLSGKTKETGNLEEHKEPTLGIEAWQYSGKVEFVQTVTLRQAQGDKNIRTNVSGSIEFQTCTNDKCLPPKTIQFSVMLGE